MEAVKEGNSKIIHLTDGMLCSLASAPDGYYNNLAETWQRPIARIKNVDISYRSLNYLSSIGLFAEKRDEEGKGWRELSFVECIYLDLIAELRNFNVKAQVLRGIYEAFNTKASKDAKVLQNIWLDALIITHCLNTEAYLFINVNGKVDFCDAGSALIYMRINAGSTIVVPLSRIINKFRIRNNLKPIQINHDMFDSGLKTSELDMVSKIRDLDENEKIEYTKKKNGGLITTSQKINKEMFEKLSSLVEEDFGSIKAIKEGGKVVSVQKETKNLVIDD